MDYEALKESWSEVEDRDGVRLSWNVFPSSRMVRKPPNCRAPGADLFVGSLEARCPHRRAVHPPQGEARHTAASIRTCHMQAAMSFSTESLLVC